MSSQLTINEKRGNHTNVLHRTERKKKWLVSQRGNNDEKKKREGRGGSACECVNRRRSRNCCVFFIGGGFTVNLKSRRISDQTWDKSKGRVKKSELDKEKIYRIKVVCRDDRLKGLEG